MILFTGTNSSTIGFNRDNRKCARTWQVSGKTDVLWVVGSEPSWIQPISDSLNPDLELWLDVLLRPFRAKPAAIA